jgi:hypothetical protein
VTFANYSTVFPFCQTEKKQRSRQKEPEPAVEEDADNEIMDLSDPEKITKERGGWW